MALIPCPDCSAEIWDDTVSCPRCAFQFRNTPKSFYGIILRIIFVVFNIFMMSSVVIGLMEADIELQKLLYPVIFWLGGATILGVLCFMNPAKKYSNPNQQSAYMIRQRGLLLSFLGLLAIFLYLGLMMGVY